MMPANQVSPWPKLRTNTDSSGRKCHVLVCWSYLFVTFACFEHEMLSLVAAGPSGSADIYPLVVIVLVFVLPVVEWGVILYWKRKWDSLVSKHPLVSFFNPSFKIWITLSAKPFDAGWYVGCSSNVTDTISQHELLKVTTGEHTSIVRYNSPW